MSIVSNIPEVNPSKFFTRRVSFDDYEPAVIEPTDVLSIHPPPYSSQTSSEDENSSIQDGFKTPGKSPCSIAKNYHLKSILKKQEEEGPINTARKLYEIPGTGIKKSLLDMTDQELTLLDSQFSTKSVDVEKNYRFDSDPRLSPLTNAAAAVRKGGADSYSFSLLKMSDYPTKPIIKKNSICLNFKHAKYSQKMNSNKFYLILISKYKSSLSAIDFYLENYSKSGDNIVICASISNVFDQTMVERCILDLVGLILEKFTAYDKDLAIQVNFEFFHKIDYMSETLNLYQPSLIIVGSRENRNKYTSMATTTKNFVPLVYVGTNYKPMGSSGGVKFKAPFNYDRSANPFSSSKKPIQSLILSPKFEPTEVSPQSSQYFTKSSSYHTRRSSDSDGGQGSSQNDSSGGFDADDEDYDDPFRDPKTSQGSMSVPMVKIESVEEPSSHNKVKPTFPFLNAVPHLNQISRADKELQSLHPHSRATSTPSLGATAITKTKSNPASFSGASSSNEKSMPVLRKVTTIPAVITPASIEKNALFERYNRRMSSVKIPTVPKNVNLGSTSNLSSPQVSPTSSLTESGAGPTLLNSFKSKPKISRTDSDDIAVKSSSSSESLLRPPLERSGSSSTVKFFKKLWKHK